MGTKEREIEFANQLRKARLAFTDALVAASILDEISEAEGAKFHVWLREIEQQVIALKDTIKSLSQKNGEIK